VASVREPSGKFYIDVDPQGIVLIRGPADQRIGLPVYVTDSRSHATGLVVRLCSKSIDGEHYVLPDTLFKTDLPEMEAVKQLQSVKDAFAKLDNPSSKEVDRGMAKLLQVTKSLTGNDCYEVKVRSTAEITTFFNVFAPDLSKALEKAKADIDSWEDPLEDHRWVITYLEGTIQIVDLKSKVDPTQYMANEAGL
jgi:hypothetical protein